jgi:hypothetical protein
MPKKNRKTSGASGRQAPNVLLTKERVRKAMLELRAAGEVITSKSILQAAGGRGSFSTLLKWRKEIEAEEPDLCGENGLSRDQVVRFIGSCDRAVLPALEKALHKRRRTIRFERGFLVLSLDDGTMESQRVLEALWAKNRPDIGWTLQPTKMNYESALRAGFTTGRDVEIRKELDKIESQAELRT